jgi:DNA-binding XRE family transcriptional regulator
MDLDRSSFIASCDEHLKLVRTEFGFTQDDMAYLLGISKKTLVDIEKGRRTLGWTGSVALCSLFGESEVISSAFGGNPTDMILALAFEGRPFPRRRVISGKIWWTVICENERYMIQQNIISQHCRLLTSDLRRVASSFDIDDLMPIFNNVHDHGKQVKNEQDHDWQNNGRQGGVS